MSDNVNYTPQDLQDNLNYLSQTKELIKQSIIAKGQTITSSTTFREYASKIDDISTGCKVFSSISEMNADTNKHIGDLAIVTNTTYTDLVAEEPFASIRIKTEVELDSSWNVNCTMLTEDNQYKGRIGVTNEDADLIFLEGSPDYSHSQSWTNVNGTYTCQTSVGSDYVDIDLNSAWKLFPNDVGTPGTMSQVYSEFVKVKKFNFLGLYECKEKILSGQSTLVYERVNGVDCTLDATSEANDILAPKTAYSKGRKLTGSIIPTIYREPLTSYTYDNGPDHQYFVVLPIDDTLGPAQNFVIQKWTYDDLYYFLLACYCDNFDHWKWNSTSNKWLPHDMFDNEIVSGITYKLFRSPISTPLEWSLIGSSNGTDTSWYNNFFGSDSMCYDSDGSVFYDIGSQKRTEIITKLERDNTNYFNTSDSDATSEDISNGKVAYINGGKVTGTSIKTIKQFDTEQHMQEDLTKAEGDLAVIYGNSITNWDGTIPVNSLTFPDTVTISSTDYDMNNLYNADGTVRIMMEVNSNSAYFYVTNYKTSTRFTIDYTSNDGITYTRTDNNGNPIVFSDSLIEFTGEFNSIFSSFMLVENTWFEGLYECNNVPGNLKGNLISELSIDTDTNEVIIGSSSLNINNIDYDTLVERILSAADYIRSTYSIYDRMNFLITLKDSNTLSLICGCETDTSSITQYTWLHMPRLVFDSTTKEYKYIIMDLNDATYFLEFRFDLSTGTFDTVKYIESNQYIILRDYGDNETNYYYTNSFDSYYILGSIYGSYFSSDPFKFSDEYQFLIYDYYFTKHQSTNTPSIVWKLKYISAKNQLTLSNSNQLLPGVKAYGKNEVVTGDSSVYHNIKIMDMLREIGDFTYYDKGSYIYYDDNSEGKYIHHLDKTAQNFTESLVYFRSVPLSHEWDPIVTITSDYIIWWRNDNVSDEYSTSTIKVYSNNAECELLATFNLDTLDGRYVYSNGRLLDNGDNKIIIGYISSYNNKFITYIIDMNNTPSITKSEFIVTVPLSSVKNYGSTVYNGHVYTFWDTKAFKDGVGIGSLTYQYNSSYGCVERIGKYFISVSIDTQSSNNYMAVNIIDMSTDTVTSARYSVPFRYGIPSITYDTTNNLWYISVIDSSTLYLYPIDSSTCQIGTRKDISLTESISSSYTLLGRCETIDNKLCAHFHGAAFKSLVIDLSNNTGTIYDNNHSPSSNMAVNLANSLDTTYTYGKYNDAFILKHIKPFRKVSSTPGDGWLINIKENLNNNRNGNYIVLGNYE